MKLIKILALGFVSFQAHANQPNFSINWQHDINQIKASQTNKLVEIQAHRLTYKSELFNEEFEQEFLFNQQGKLSNVLYYKSFKVTDENCVSQYKYFKDAATKQFGQSETVAEGDIASCQSAANAQYRLTSLWQTNSEKVSLKLNTWKGVPYIGLSIEPSQ
ncbi:MAG: hypothetical protein HRU22_06655 [Gammaproteobacteria bacterium]|nr:hypothetical protein [Gammaproteobacteria bacterium]